ADPIHGEFRAKSFVETKGSVHFARDQFYPNITLDASLTWLADSLDIKLSGDDRLMQLRDWDRHWFKPNQTGF
ncbi:MAG: hypothetical protein AAGA66_05940, partial [Bacteroidota bacterium]